MPDELPDDVDALKGRIRALESQLLLSWLCYAQLDYTHKDLLRRVYRHRSEKLKTVLKNSGKTQPSASTDVTTAATTATADNSQTPGQPRKHGGGGRREPPERLPIVREVIDLPEDQKAGLRWIRDEITTQLGYRPSQYYLLQIVRPVYASPAREEPPRVVPLPPQVIPQAGVHVSFIVHVILQRYAFHIPYYRQEAIDALDGVFVARQARYRYAVAAANLLRTIRDGLKQMLLKSGYILIDETFADLIDPQREGRTRICYLWGYMSPQHKAAVIEFSLSRSGVILEEFFEDSNFKGAIGSDGARMYTRFIKKHPHIRHHLCVQHFRRYLIAALEADEKEALPLLEQIGALYAIETQADEAGMNDRQRGCLRHALSKPILKALQKRLLELKASPHLMGNLRKAVRYATNRWRELASFAKVNNGHIRPDSNQLEALWRPVKVGFRNSLFVGHPAAGWVSAVLYSIMATCSLLHINARDYLLWVLPKLAARKTTDDPQGAHHGLLPHDFAQWQAGEYPSPQPTEKEQAATPRKPKACSVMPLPEDPVPRVDPAPPHPGDSPAVTLAA